MQISSQSALSMQVVVHRLSIRIPATGVQTAGAAETLYNITGLLGNLVKVLQVDLVPVNTSDAALAAQIFRFRLYRKDTSPPVVFDRCYEWNGDLSNSWAKVLDDWGGIYRDLDKTNELHCSLEILAGQTNLALKGQIEYEERIGEFS